jgi:serine/threonine protein kinase
VADYFPLLFKLLAKWDPLESAVVLDALRDRWEAMQANKRFNLRLADVIGWIRAHEDDPDRADAVAECIAVDAPLEVQITRRLTQRGAQKRVFRGTWTVADDPPEIVLKKLKDYKTLQGEQRPHPLAMQHPNVIEVFTLPNAARDPEVYLVERYVEVLNDDRLPRGQSEAAQLLVDLGRALAFISDHGLIHGDLKSDNIGYTSGHFLLLDFGICMTRADAIRSRAQIGSVRTRAPELIHDGFNSAASDVWSLAATVFRALCGRYPLYHGFGEAPSNDKVLTPPRLNTMRKRSVPYRYERQLAPLRKVGDRRLRELLYDALLLDPENRPTAHELVSEALVSLPGLVGDQNGPSLPPDMQVTELGRFLSLEPPDGRLLPNQKARDLDEYIGVLQRGLVAQRPYQLAANSVAALYSDLQRDAASNRVLLPAPAAEDVDMITRSVRDDLAPRDRQSQRNLDRLRKHVRKEMEPLAAPDREDLGAVLARSLRVAAVKTYAHGEIETVAHAYRELRELATE